MDKGLKIHEWLAVAVLIVTLGGLSVIAHVSNGPIADKERSAPAFLSKPGKIEVLIEGAVVHPGIYYLPAGTAMKEVFQIAQLAPNADPRRFNMNALIKKGRVINVPLKAMMTVLVKGAVKNPGKISIPKGTRLMDLTTYIQLNENADIKSLNRKRKLKEGEVVEVLMR